MASIVKLHVPDPNEPVRPVPVPTPGPPPVPTPPPIDDPPAPGNPDKPIYTPPSAWIAGAPGTTVAVSR